MNPLERYFALFGHKVPEVGTVLTPPEPSRDPLLRLVDGMAVAIEDHCGGHGSRALRLHLHAAVLQHMLRQNITQNDRETTDRELDALLAELESHTETL